MERWADYDRVWQDIEHLKRITEPHIPLTRRAFTERYLEGRAWITQRLKDLGLSPYLDSMANLRAHYPGEKMPNSIIALGSHSDTVIGGGAFDGILGVVAGLELFRQIKERDLTLDLSLEFIDFLAEETTDWGISCIGSRGLSGQLTEADLAAFHPENKESLQDAIVRMGGQPEARHKDEAIARQQFVAFLELHIEQGPLLESLSSNDKPVLGLVTDLVGITRLQITLSGQSNHSGTTPMHMRQDALITAAHLIVEVEKIAQSLANMGEGHFVATVGKIDNFPNSINVVPGRTELFIDLRTTNTHLKQLFKKRLADFLETLRISHQVRTITDTSPVKFNEDLLSTMEKIAKNRSFITKRLASGAGHDAAFMAQITKTAMLFIPSRNGLSHHPEEWSSKEAVGQGVELFIQSILELAGARGV